MRFPQSRQLLAAAALLTLVTVTATAQRLFADITGKWSLSVTTPQGTNASPVTFKQDGDALTGTVEIEQVGTRNLTGTVKGDTVRFAFTIDAQGTPLELRVTGMVKGKDAMEGQLEAPNGMGSFPFTAKRVQ